MSGMISCVILMVPQCFSQLSSSELRLYTDASGAVGYAAVFGSQWFKGE